VAFRHALPGRVLPVSGIRKDIVRPHHTFAQKSRREHRGCARHRIVLERGPRCAGQCVQHVAAALGVEDIVEEGAERGAGELDAGVGDDLHDLLEIKLLRDGSTSVVEDMQMPLGLLSCRNVDHRADEARGTALLEDRVAGCKNAALDTVFNAMVRYSIS
jgi:hypothetical protein